MCFYALYFILKTLHILRIKPLEFLLLSKDRGKQDMPKDKLCKTVHQYSKGPVPEEDMQRLLEIAEDYKAVKNYVYTRFGGIKSLAKLYPGYTVQNEMTASGLRERINMPSVYFYLAVFDALGDIKGQWGRTKSAVLKNVNRHENLTMEEKHYLRFLLRVNNAFEAALNHSPLKLPKGIQKQYDSLASQVDVSRLESYLGRQVRKLHITLHTEIAAGFSIGERAYRYGDHGIYISIKEKRKRIFIPLTDSNSYTRQLYVCLFPEEKRIEIKVPVDVTAKRHRDYKSRVGISMGMMTMLTTDEGHRYGEEYGVYQTRLSDWMAEQGKTYNQNREANPGRKKYFANKKRQEDRLHSYINQELNRFLRTEKPEIIYLPKLPPSKASGPVRKMNHYLTMWQRGYIQNRLVQKCREQSVQLVEVLGKDISNQCSCCGALGKKEDQLFFCPQCGYQTDQKRNAAQNARKRGEEQCGK